jgi:hypothetical protein
MTSFDPRAIRDALRERSVALNPPITIEALDRLTRWAGDALHVDVIALLREFDGFSDGDFEAQSFVSIWPVDKAIEDDWTKHPMLAFSDWSLNAILFGFDPVTGGSVISIEDARQVAPTYRDFWSLLLTDRLL